MQSLQRPWLSKEGNDPSKKRPQLLVLFSGSHSPKLAISITTDQLAPSVLIAVESASLDELEPENETNNLAVPI